MAFRIIETGSMLDDDAMIHVVPVNCIGVMGAGLALAYKQRYPECESHYMAACKGCVLEPGRPFIPHVPYGPYTRGAGKHALTLCHFPTKRHWRDPSRMIDIYTGLAELARRLDRRKFVSIAIPALGCGLGGLPWQEVLEELRRFAGHIPQHDVRVYAPKG